MTAAGRAACSGRRRQGLTSGPGGRTSDRRETKAAITASSLPVTWPRRAKGGASFSAVSDKGIILGQGRPLRALDASRPRKPLLETDGQTGGGILLMQTPYYHLVFCPASK